MWNQDSEIWRNWRAGFRFIPSISLPRNTIAIPLLTTPTAGGVYCVAFLPDGNRIVSSSEGKLLRVWDAKSGEQLRKVQHTARDTSVAFSPDGNQIVSRSISELWMWDARMDEQLREL